MEHACVGGKYRDMDHKIQRYRIIYHVIHVSAGALGNITVLTSWSRSKLISEEQYKIEWLLKDIERIVHVAKPWLCSWLGSKYWYNYPFSFGLRIHDYAIHISIHCTNTYTCICVYCISWVEKVDRLRQIHKVSLLCIYSISNFWNVIMPQSFMF